jgi:uncharacterized membrane protein
MWHAWAVQSNRLSLSSVRCTLIQAQAVEHRNILVLLLPFRSHVLGLCLCLILELHIAFVLWILRQRCFLGCGDMLACLQSSLVNRTSRDLLPFHNSA